jgi:flagellar protein FlbD
MITLHRLGHARERFQLNPDLIVSVESTPDTVITLATTAKVVVCDTPEQIAEAVRRWRVEVLSCALQPPARGEDTRQHAPARSEPPPLTAVAARRALAAVQSGH